MYSFRRIIQVYLLSIVSVLGLSAEELVWSPQHFVRVQSVDEIESGAYYLVAGVSQKDGHVLMTSSVVNKKLKGFVYPQSECIFCEDASQVWQIFCTDGDVILRAAEVGKYLLAPQSNKPDVELHASEYTIWKLLPKDDGVVLKHAQEQRRYLHTSYQANAQNPNPFGNYFYTEGTVETNKLYLYKLDADYTPPTDNTITYLNDGDPTPAYGNLIVRNGVLLYPSVLLDAAAFLPTSSFSVEEGQLTYTRVLNDTGWETLSLPFAADVPSEIDARELERIDGETLVFRPVTQIRPHIPVILRSEHAVGVSVTFVSKAGVVSAPTATNHPFVPVYQQLDISSEAEDIYLLSGSGMTFTLAAYGSSLRPFRAYIKR